MPLSRQHEELLSAIFGHAQQRLRAQMGVWLTASPRFATFVLANRDKIRRKARLAAGAEATRDLYLELAVAFALTQPREFSVAYEKYAAAKARGPDFTVTYKTHTPFNVEVKRVRASVHFGRWADALCGKLAQMPPSVANVIVIAADTSAPADFAPELAMASLRDHAERGDNAFFAQHGLADAKAFLRDVQRVSATSLWLAWDTSIPRRSLWLNPHAKHRLAPEIARKLTP
jgi:hypothetical protein